MKEIIYIQAGNLSNYTGTHFWNAQESYLPHTETDETIADAEISFSESVDAKSMSTLCPRLLMFDTKSNFGTLGGNNALGSIGEDAFEDSASLWDGTSIEYRQVQIPKSDYQKIMEVSSSDIHGLSPETKALGRTIRYWSDFSRVYYLPRSLQKLPDPLSWQETCVDWKEGQDIFNRYNENSELMEGPLRQLVEDCDNMQGIQIMNDTDTFGSFLSSFLSSFRDEYLKLPSLVFPLMAGVVSQNPDCDDTPNLRRFINEALYLRTLNEFSTLNVPIQPPSSWCNLMTDSLKFATTSVYHQSAILSAHIETCTLPLRLKPPQQDLFGLSTQLNWRGSSPFAELSGVFPFTSNSNFEDNLVNFSVDAPFKSSTRYTWLDVTRGFSSMQIRAYEKWSSTQRSSSVAYGTSVHSIAYPLPSSFPAFTSDWPSPRPPYTEASSSLSTSRNLTTLLEGYAMFIDKCARRRTTSLASIDVSLDDLKELANDLWTMHDNSSAENDESST